MNGVHKVAIGKALFLVDDGDVPFTRQKREEHYAREAPSLEKIKMNNQVYFAEDGADRKPQKLSKKVPTKKIYIDGNVCFAEDGGYDATQTRDYGYRKGVRTPLARGFKFENSAV